MACGGGRRRPRAGAAGQERRAQGRGQGCPRPRRHRRWAPVLASLGFAFTFGNASPPEFRTPYLFGGFHVPRRLLGCAVRSQKEGWDQGMETYLPTIAGPGRPFEIRNQADKHNANTGTAMCKPGRYEMSTYSNCSCRLPEFQLHKVLEPRAQQK
jgi:hypothetical protein